VHALLPHGARPVDPDGEAERLAAKRGSAEPPDHYEDVITIEWGAPEGAGHAMKGWAIQPRTLDGRPITTVMEMVIRARGAGPVWAELTMFADAEGHPSYGADVTSGTPLARLRVTADGKIATATFPFLVAGMTVRGKAAPPLAMPAEELALARRALEALDRLGDSPGGLVVLGDAGPGGNWPAPDARAALVSLGWTPPPPDGGGAAWLRDVTETPHPYGTAGGVRLTHAPSGVTGDGNDRDGALYSLIAKLVRRGDITVNDGRAAIGLAPWRPEMPVPGTEAAQ
jgi:hypothetical protein